jgi:hypothetical protein
VAQFYQLGAAAFQVENGDLVLGHRPTWVSPATTSARSN